MKPVNVAVHAFKALLAGSKLTWTFARHGRRQPDTLSRIPLSSKVIQGPTLPIRSLGHTLRSLGDTDRSSRGPMCQACWAALPVGHLLARLETTCSVATMGEAT